MARTISAPLVVGLDSDQSVPALPGDGASLCAASPQRTPRTSDDVAKLARKIGRNETQPHPVGHPNRRFEPPSPRRDGRRRRHGCVPGRRAIVAEIVDPSEISVVSHLPLRLRGPRDGARAVVSTDGGSRPTRRSSIGIPTFC
jgi:hypothetical protein